MKIRFVTSNPNKVTELSERLAPLGFEVEQVRHPYPEVQTDTLEEVAEHGLEYLAKELGSGVVLEDAGLFIDALGGFPGVYSAYVLRTLGNPGILRLMDGKQDRSARFEAVLGYLDESGERHLFKGVCPGSIAAEARGAGGFGFDPVFVPAGRDRTFAEMGVEEKGQLSHRGRAAAAFAEFLGDI